MRTTQPEAHNQESVHISSTTRLARLLDKRWARLLTPAQLVLLVGGLLRFALAWRDLDALDTLFFPDDTYLSLGIARNIARGLGSTFDGRILTNGYQPLYVWLMAPVYWLMPDDRTLPIHIALTLLALVGAATGWLVYRIVRYLSTPWHATIACAIWMFDPIVLTHSLNGLETGLALLGIAATSLWYLERIRARASVASRDILALGLLIGLTILTRVDQCFLLAALALDMLLDRPDWRTLWRIGLIGLVALLVNAPWLGFSWSIGAGPLPESGTAVRYIALAESSGHPAWYLSALVVLLSTALTAPRSTLALLVGGIVVMLVHRRRGQPNQWLRAGWARMRPLRFAGFYAAVLFLAYWLYIPAYWFFDRYAHPLALFALLSSAQALPEPQALAPRARRALVAVTLIGVLIEATLGVQLLVARPRPDGYLPLARWVNANLAGQTVGLYQSGAVGYWADRVTIVNLDGVVDRTALAARRAGHLGELLRERKVGWVVDWDPPSRLPADGILNMLGEPQKIPDIQSWGSPWYVFEVR
jgi:hypothetical protein